VGIEIERKFLLADRSIVEGLAGTRIAQGYLSTDADRVVRVRQAGDRAFLTIKGRGEGARRPEFEYEVPVDDADELLGLCLRPIVRKVRYRVEHGGRRFEIDVFEAENEGLAIVELELPSEHETVDLPDWVGDEVTLDPRYANANLVARPFQTWADGAITPGGH
jgi:CYTH domain-containing protein